VTQTAHDTTSIPATGLPVVTFQVAGKAFAVELPLVEQIVEYRPPTPTPRRPPFVEGLLEYRGQFVPVLSLRRRFGVADEQISHPAILLLRGIGPDPVIGVAVDQVLRVLSLSRDAVLAPPPKVFGIRAEYIRGVANAGGRPIVWLEMGKVFASAEPILLLA
jgi:purine-binding chemotaxis protein CheW